MCYNVVKLVKVVVKVLKEDEFFRLYDTCFEEKYYEKNAFEDYTFRLLLMPLYSFVVLTIIWFLRSEGFLSTWVFFGLLVLVCLSIVYFFGSGILSLVKGRRLKDDFRLKITDLVNYLEAQGLLKGFTYTYRKLDILDMSLLYKAAFAVGGVDLVTFYDYLAKNNFEVEERKVDLYGVSSNYVKLVGYLADYDLDKFMRLLEVLRFWSGLKVVNRSKYFSSKFYVSELDGILIEKLGKDRLEKKYPLGKDDILENKVDWYYVEDGGIVDGRGKRVVLRKEIKGFL